MDPSRIAFGLWNAASSGRGPHSGPSREETLRLALDAGVRTIITSDALEGGAADRAVGAVLSSPGMRDRMHLVGCLGGPTSGHAGPYAGAAARLTDLSPEDLREGVREAALGILERTGAGQLDLLLYESPDRNGFRSAALWDAMADLKAAGLTRAIGIAPGPGNGHVLDFLHFLDRFGDRVDAAMIVFHPLEPWPGELVLAAAQARGVRIIGRESVPPPGPAAGRAHEERGQRMGRVFELASRHGLNGWELLTAWTTSHAPVFAYAPRVLPSAEQSLEDTVRALGAAVPEPAGHVAEAFAELRQIGENKGRVPLKGGTQQFQGAIQAEQWPLDEELAAAAARHGLVPDRDLYCPGDPRDLREFGMPVRGVPQAIDRRLYLQLQVLTGVADRPAVVEDLRAAGAAAVAYADLNDPRGIGILLWDENPLRLSAKADFVHALPSLRHAALRPEFTMLGRSYAFGREEDVEYWLLRRPVEVATWPDRPWAVWYPLRRKPSFYRLPKDEQADMLREHGLIGHNFGSAGYATDIRLECFGMDAADNEFVLGLLSVRLDWLSRLVKEMRATRQTGEYMDHLGPFFVGHTLYQHAGPVTHA